MAFIFLRLINLEDEVVSVNVYHIMTMKAEVDAKEREYTEITLVNGEILNVLTSPQNIRSSISRAEGGGR